MSSINRPGGTSTASHLPIPSAFVSLEELQTWIDDIDTRQPGAGRVALARLLLQGGLSPFTESLMRQWLEENPPWAERRSGPDRRGWRRRLWKLWRAVGRRDYDRPMASRATLVWACIACILMAAWILMPERHPPPPPSPVGKFNPAMPEFPPGTER